MWEVMPTVYSFRSISRFCPSRQADTMGRRHTSARNTAVWRPRSSANSRTPVFAGLKLECSELAQLDTATRSVDVAIYSFTDRFLAEELATLARKGVPIRVYRDREQFSQEMERAGSRRRASCLQRGSRFGSKAQGIHAPQELRRRWTCAANGFGELLSDWPQVPR